jgi:cell division inhibitor SulA/protein ImuA
VKRKKTTLADIPKHPMLWRGKDLVTQAGLKHANDTVIASGYAELDQHLAGGGWPQQGLVDLLLPQAGIGELRLILPMLQQLSESAYIVWINPPFIPYATALHACGVNTEHILVVRSQCHEETLWSMERCCLSSGCAAVLAWPQERQLNIKETRRIQLAARSGRTLAIFFRPSSAVERSSLAELRLALQPAKKVDQLTVDIVKRKGGWPVQGITLSLTRASQRPYEVMQTLHQQLAIWQKDQQQQQVRASLTANTQGSEDFTYPASTPEQNAATQEGVGQNILH